jgi:hydrogenase/urease accessory protein HupE
MLRFITWVLFGLMAASAWAHDSNLTGIKIIRRTHDYVVSVSAHLSALGVSPTEAGSALTNRLHISFDGVSLRDPKPLVIVDRPNDQIIWQSTQKGSFRSFEVGQRLFPELPDSKTIVSLTNQGMVTEEILLDEAHPDYVPSRVPESGPAVAVRFIRMGWLHILSGADHVLFVLGLLLLGGSLKSLLKTITAFTVAHSITLTLTALGIAHASPRWVEPLIALSIVAIAFENLRAQRNRAESADRGRPLIAFAFGLIHGFGFAGALTGVGLTGPSLWIGLGTFNLGVEFGQTSIILLTAPLIGWASRQHPGLWNRMALAGSLVIGVLGGMWFVQRL